MVIVITIIIFVGIVTFVLLQSWQEHERRGRVTLKFVGIRHRTQADYQRYLKLKKGEKVLFVKEPDNPKDPNAVKVVTMDGYHIGYVAREDTYYINCYPDNTYIGRFYRYDSERQDYHYVRFYAKDNGMDY